MSRAVTQNYLQPLREHLLRSLWENNYERDYPFVDCIWDEFIRHIEEKGIKQKNYIYNLSKHLALVACGVESGFSPCLDNQVAPVSLFKDVFSDFYKIRYTPTIMTSKHFDNDKKETLYYSLQCPIHLAPFPNKNTATTGLDDLRAIQSMMEMFVEYLNHEKKKQLEQSLLIKVGEETCFEYFHVARDVYNKIQSSSCICDQDNTFQDKNFDLPFCQSSSFFKGCIKLIRT